MEFIIQKAIEGILIDKSQAKALAEIICHTSNPEHAVNVLFNNYQHPLFHAHKYGRNENEEYTFTSYCPWTDTVVYSYLRNKIKHIYISKEAEEKEITPENYKEFEKSWDSKSSKHFTVIFPEKETGNSTCSKADWDKFKNNHTKFVIDLEDVLDNPEDYDLI
jgi:hypothetical protein